MIKTVRMLLQVNHPDADVQRRGFGLIVICLGLISISLAGMPIIFIRQGNILPVLILLASTLTISGFIFTARIGHVGPAASGLIMLVSVVISVTPMLTGEINMFPIFAPLILLIASITMPMRTFWFTVPLALAPIVITPLSMIARPQTPLDGTDVVLTAIILTAFTGVVGVMGSIGNASAVQDAEVATVRANTVMIALEATNRELEKRVAERTAALNEAKREVEERAETQAKLLNEIEAQRTIIRELSVPVLPVSEDVLVMPLIGDLDGNRLAYVRSQALSALERTRARVVLIDVTGVPVIDTQVAQGFVDITKSARLLGAKTILIGIRPEVAQTIISLGIDLSSVGTASNLQGALRGMRG